jgi:hypothetical protein
VKTILTHIGGEPPPYLRDCLRQFRVFNPGAETVLIAAEKYLERDEAFLREVGVEPVPAEDFDSDPRLKEFRQRNRLQSLGTPETSFPSQPGFWEHTMGRYFFIASLMERTGLENIFHFENDVLIYRDLREILAGIGRCGQAGMYATPVGRHWASCGLLFVDRAESLGRFCDFALEAVARDPREIERESGVDMVNDMTLLKLYGAESEALHYFPILPEGRHAYGLGSFGSVFDGASWGQFAGGTNGGQAPGWAGRHHYIGREILKGKYRLSWEGHELKRPFAVDRRGRKTPINNLHIHSKRLDLYLSRSAVAPQAPPGPSKRQIFLSHLPLPQQGWRALLWSVIRRWRP